MTFKESEGGSFKRTFLMKDRLQKGHFDMAVLFQNAFECAFTAWMAGIKLRVGYPTDLRGALLNIKAPLIPSILSGHQVFYYLEIVKYLDSYFRLGRFQYLSKPDCSIKLPVKEVDKARKILLEAGVDPKAPFVCLCPGSVNSDAKRWLQEHYAVLADILIERGGLQIIFLGATQEVDLINSIIGEMKKGPAFNLAAKSNIVVSLGIMSLSSLVISNDTGSAHLAIAAGAKCLTIFGPTIAGATAPFGNRAYIIQGKAECAPCNDHNCRRQGHPCMKSLSPELVARKASEIMAPPPSA
jgi:heptosyltransferase-2